MLTNRNRAAYVLTGGFFLLLDQFLKWQSLRDWTEKNLANKFFGWEPFANYGAAFGLPVPNWLVVSLTAPALFLIAYLFVKQNTNTPPPLPLPRREGGNIRTFALAVLFFGALSNLIDRLVHGYVVDYLRVFTGVINIADVMIMAGLIIYLFKKKF